MARRDRQGRAGERAAGRRLAHGAAHHRWTIYPAGFIYERNIMDMALRPHGDVPGVTYRFYPCCKALFDFGYGRCDALLAMRAPRNCLWGPIHILCVSPPHEIFLGPQITFLLSARIASERRSYTTFRFCWGGGRGEEAATSGATWTATTAGLHAALPAYYEDTLAAAGVAVPVFGLSVSNTGKVASDVVVLCFVASSAPGAPLKQLAAFHRVGGLQPGAAALLQLRLAPTTLTTVDAAGVERFEAGKFAVTCGGEPDETVTGELAVSGSPVTVFEMP
jgi:hypothetical protein